MLPLIRLPLFQPGRSRARKRQNATRRFQPHCELLESRLTPATLAVTTTSDAAIVDGGLSLREAIASINSGADIDSDVTHTGAYGVNDTIKFTIPCGGVRTIKPDQPYPALGTPVAINGYTQQGSAFNNSSVGDNAKLMIVIDGSLAGSSANGLTIMADNCSVIGLVINNFGQDGILVKGNHATIQGDFIGTDVTGKVARGNGNAGIEIFGTNNAVGAAVSLARNLISGNLDGMHITGASNSFVNNLIGVDASGTKKLGNQGYGVHLASNGNTFGGAGGGAGNVVSGNGTYGLIVSGSNNVVAGNRIGTDAAGDNLGNGYIGVRFNGSASNNLIGGTIPETANYIAFNCSAPPANSPKAGLSSDAGSSGTGNAILGNLIYANAGPLIDFGLDTLNPNDSGDPDTGFNNLQNFPVVNVAAVESTGSAISGTFSGSANGSFRLEFYIDGTAANPAVYLGFTQVYTDASGVTPFFFTTPTFLPFGTVSATATDAAGNTSEFCLPTAVKQTLGGDATGFVSMVFLDFLHRLPDTGGLSFFVKQINSGVPHAQVVQAIQNNDEYRHIVVSDLFGRLLHRAADPLAWLGFSNQLASGTTVEQIEVTMLGSAEYLQNRGAGSTYGFVGAAFSDLLGRTSDPGALNYFVGLIGGGTSRNAVAQQLVGSQEAAQFTVDRLFQQYLHRHADPAGKVYFGNLLAAGQARQEQLAVMLATSNEYYLFV